MFSLNYLGWKNNLTAELPETILSLYLKSSKSGWDTDEQIGSWGYPRSVFPKLGQSFVFPGDNKGVLQHNLEKC